MPLVESSQTPLIIAGEVEHRRVIWVGFDFLQSFWPYRTSFPIFLQNAMEWLNPSSANAGEFLVKAGEPFRFTLANAANSVDVTMPDGAKKAIPLDKNSREIVFGETTKQGIYKLRAGTNELSFCVNLMDAAESDIRPRDELPIGKFGAGVVATKIERTTTELWRWIALAGLCVLMFEWWWYHKRTA